MARSNARISSVVLPLCRRYGVRILLFLPARSTYLKTSTEYTTHGLKYSSYPTIPVALRPRKMAEPQLVQPLHQIYPTGRNPPPAASFTVVIASNPAYVRAGRGFLQTSFLELAYGVCAPSTSFPLFRPRPTFPCQLCHASNIGVPAPEELRTNVSKKLKSPSGICHLATPHYEPRYERSPVYVYKVRRVLRQMCSPGGSRASAACRLAEQLL